VVLACMPAQHLWVKRLRDMSLINVLIVSVANSYRASSKANLTNGEKNARIVAIRLDASLSELFSIGVYNSVVGK